MALVCARMSCRESAAASIQFDAEESRVIIVDLADSVVGIPVCRTHVATRNAPVGWTLHDRRTFTQQQLVAADGLRRRTPMIYSGRSATFAPTVNGPADRPSLRRPAPPISRFPWDDDPTDPGGASAPPPSIDDVSSPLLRRAFRQN